VRRDAASRTTTRDDRLAPGRVGLADHDDVGDRRVEAQNLLDLRGVHVLATGDDHVSEPARDVEVAVGVEAAEIAGSKPPVVEQLLRGERHAVVARAVLGRPRPHLADLARGSKASVTGSWISTSTHGYARPADSLLGSPSGRAGSGSSSVKPPVVSVMP
jgi:hypothetical protein